MRNDDSKSATGWRIVAGLFAAGLCVILIIGLVTGDISSSRRPYLNRSSDPAFFWAHMILIAIAAAIAALFALGRVKLKPPPDYVAGVSRQTAGSFAFLALLGAAGTGYAWISERLSGHESAMPEIAGWTALAMLGVAMWPPVLSPGPMRTALRAAGTAAIFLAATMIYLLTR
jgi:hypothetical protein